MYHFYSLAVSISQNFVANTQAGPETLVLWASSLSVSPEGPLAFVFTAGREQDIKLGLGQLSRALDKRKLRM